MIEIEQLRIALAISTAIEEGQLLSARPADEDAVMRHETAIALLDVQRDILRGAATLPLGQPYIVEVRPNPAFAPGDGDLS